MKGFTKFQTFKPDQWLACNAPQAEHRPAALQIGWIQHVEGCAECRERVKTEKANSRLLNSVQKIPEMPKYICYRLEDE